MSKVKLPAEICGNWIWLKEYSHKDSFLLFRKEFNKEAGEENTDLWISANTAYQLFINDQLVGFGPSGHYNPGSCYIDQHNIEFYLEPGRNVIALKAFYGVDCSGTADERPPGLWCQAMADRKMIFCSDDSWMVMGADFCSGRRPRIAAVEGMTDLFHAEKCPRGWTALDFRYTPAWTAPDSITAIEKFALRPELFPMPPPVIAPENPEFSLFKCGYVSECPCWTGVQFRNKKRNAKETFAAAGYIFSESTQTVKVLLYADDPFKLYCNFNLVAEADYADGAEREISLVPGWNRLLLVQTPGVSSMGFMMVMPEISEQNSFVIRQDMLDSANGGWCIAGPLRLTMPEATPSLRFDRLQIETFECNVSLIPSIEALLDNSVLEISEEADADQSMKNGDFRIWKLPYTHYGFLKINIESGIGDIVDISVSTECGKRSAFAGVTGKRSIGTMFCRGGVSSYITFIPADCLYAGIFVRSSRNGVKILSVEFEELTREFYREADFKCSDALLNRLWTAGHRMLMRTVSTVPMADSRASQDVFLFDAYADAVNVSTMIGDSVYIACRLRQFLEFQLENGDIPAITHGVRRQPQLHHMLFLPRWIMHNYVFSGSVVELERSLPALDFVREFFESMIDPEWGLLVFPQDWHKAESRLSNLDFNQGRVSSCLNSLYCRFLLSASDVYRISDNRNRDSIKCFKLAEKIADQLRTKCKDDKTGLFHTWADRGSNDVPFDCFCNFAAMYGGVMDPDDFETFFYQFFNYDPPFDKYDSLTPYSSILFTEMMFACGQRRWIYRYLRDYWEKRLNDDDSGWLDKNGCTAASTTFANGTVISPNVFLIREIVGLRSGENGHNVFYFHPGADFVESAEGLVPLANGRIFVKWQRTENGELDVILDSNVPISIMPEMSQDRLHRTSFQLSDKVTLLKPPDDFDDEADW